jgi:retron-type reverse transcriptase
MEWTIHVHLAAAENQDKNNQIYYKLPEQLEKHHQARLKTRGENATLSKTEKMRENFTKLVTSTSQQAIVLPAISFQKKNLGAQKIKGKEKESTIQSGMFY